MGLYQLKKLMHIKGNNYQNKVMTYRIEKNLIPEYISTPKIKHLNIKIIQFKTGKMNK
jgi:hypothetical protein